jgi:transcriptional regulator with XRE-family HTH domain
VSASRTTTSRSRTRSSPGGELSARDADADDGRLYERELLYGEVVEHLRAITGSQNLTQREVAHRLGVSEARMSRIFSGRENLTLKTLADLGWALGMAFEVVPRPLADRTATPAANDPPPPRWLQRHASLVAKRVRDALRVT